MQRTPTTPGGNNASPTCRPSLPTGSGGGGQESTFVRSRSPFFSRCSAGETRDPVDGTTSPVPPEQVAAEPLQTGRPATDDVFTVPEQGQKIPIKFSGVMLASWSRLYSENGKYIGIQVDVAEGGIEFGLGRMTDTLGGVLVFASSEAPKVLAGLSTHAIARHQHSEELRRQANDSGNATSGGVVGEQQLAAVTNGEGESKTLTESAAIDGDVNGTESSPVELEMKDQPGAAMNEGHGMAVEVEMAAEQATELCMGHGEEPDLDMEDQPGAELDEGHGMEAGLDTSDGQPTELIVEHGTQVGQDMEDQSASELGVEHGMEADLDTGDLQATKVDGGHGMDTELDVKAQPEAELNEKLEQDPVQHMTQMDGGVQLPMQGNHSEAAPQVGESAQVNESAEPVKSAHEISGEHGTDTTSGSKKAIGSCIEPPATDAPQTLEQSDQTNTLVSEKLVSNEKINQAPHVEGQLVTEPHDVAAESSATHNQATKIFETQFSDHISIPKESDDHGGGEGAAEAGSKSKHAHKEADGNEEVPHMEQQHETTAQTITTPPHQIKSESANMNTRRLTLFLLHVRS